MQFAYFSLTGQVKRFMDKCAFPSFEINFQTSDEAMHQPYILVVPTYEEAMLSPVFDFLDLSENQNLLIGVVGSGNRNFAEDFVFTAKNISKKYNVPLLYSFEFNGTEEDVATIKKVVCDLES